MGKSLPRTIRGRNAWLEKATYKDLMTLWYEQPFTSGWFEGEVGEHFLKRFCKVSERTALSTKQRVCKELKSKIKR